VPRGRVATPARLPWRHAGVSEEGRDGEANGAGRTPACAGGTPVTTLGAWLQARRASVLERWFELVIASYPPESAAFLRGEKDRFANPIGATLRRELPALFDAVFGPGDAEEAHRAMAAVVRLRAVQQLAPAAAVSFVPLLKRAISQELGAEEGGRAAELLDLHARIDELTLAAVNELVECREQVYRLKAHEARAQVYSLLRRAGMLVEAGVADDGKGGGEE